MPEMGIDIDIPEHLDSEIDTEEAEYAMEEEKNSESNSEYAYSENEDDLNQVRKFLKMNRIDPARAFLGKKGGYTMRDLKRFFRQTVIFPELRYDEQGKLIPPEYELG